MQRRRTLASLGLCLVLGACNAIAGIFEGKLDPRPRCHVTEDCPALERECVESVACEADHCVYTFAAEGTPLAAQVEGDCAELVCDGAGRGTRIPSGTDVPDDGNWCTEDRCQGTTATHVRLQGFGSCYDGPHETAGRGACVAGFVACEAGVEVSACTLQVTPKPENCLDPGVDDDCDGLVDEEGEGCVCGDGIHSVKLESCEDGNADPTDGCTARCEIPACGDGIVHPGESCDDGNTTDGDLCPSDCRLPVLRIELSGRNLCGIGVLACRGHSCALLQDGSVQCWGYNESGQLGQGDKENRGDQGDEMGPSLEAVKLAPGLRVVGLALGSMHTCALLQDGSIQCWGANANGQLGVGNSVMYGDGSEEMGDHLPFVRLGKNQRAVTLAAGAAHTCALLQDQSIRCWGANGMGQLGLGDGADRGTSKEAMDDLLAVNLGNGRKALALAAGAFHTCALLDGGSVKCWGSNDVGQLGLGKAGDRGDELGEMGDELPAVDLGTGKRAVAIAAGASHTCALLEGGSVKCWGENDTGQLGLGKQGNRGLDEGEMGDALHPVALGENRTAIMIAAGNRHTCALLDDHSVKCWGRNDAGELGLGNDKPRGIGDGEMGDDLPAVNLGIGKKVLQLSAGPRHTCVLLSDGSVKCWGYNASGQLGLGHTDPRGTEESHMGDALLPVALP
ncbi:DUF4215 domain-containing protein [Polyangium sp. y55x31]|uniref:RCC1 domain-containing protein n=1 Tax=Polyangium sp. y55x31 TaxID=3042688 RepID=UPI002482526E|nr:DUF4215 domain-containing protein [Polyangium sp. y55x31]MDI1476820.1 DUF4215 domain-containing protein [Polyangium sp. y55x31]